MKNQGNVILPKEHTNFPVTDSKEMKVCDLYDKDFTIVVLRKLSDL